MIRSHSVTLVNRGERTAAVREDQSILEAFESLGEALPLGCRYGACVTCAARLIEGRVDQSRGKALKQARKDEGFVLLCVAQPRSDCKLLVGAESQAGLYRNPFKQAAKTQPKF
jgi:ferredoxin